MPFHTPNTAAASAKQLRAFAGASAHVPAPDIFAVAEDDTSEQVLVSLIKRLSTPPPTNIDDALHAVFNLSNALPPRLLAPHWRTLCQKVLSICKQTTTPRALATLSALIVSSIPLSTLGSEQRAVVASISQQCLQNASYSLSVHTREALCLILAVVHATPRELRSHSFDDRLQELLSHPRRDIRELAASVLAELLICAPEKQQQQLFAQRVTYATEQVLDVLALLDAFTGRKYAGDLAEKTARQICDRLDGVCALIINLLDLPTRAILPLGDILKAVCDGVRERVIDPYAVVEGVKVNHDDMLTVIPHMQRLCARMVAEITRRVHKLALQMFIKDIGQVFEMRLSKLLLRSREDDGLACVVERRELYETIGRLITNLGTGFLHFVVPRFQELLDIDIALHRKCRAGEQKLKVDPVDGIQSGGRSRKRKRHNGRRDASLGGHSLAKDSVQSLGSVYGKQATAVVERTVDVALEVVKHIFDCRGLLTKGVIQHLERIEAALLEFLQGKRLSAVLLRAVTSAALSGGSKRMSGEASVLLMPLLTTCTTAAFDTSFSSETRDLALVARAGCEAIVHPRGPPYLQESKMYPTLVMKGRSRTQKPAGKQDDKKRTENEASKRNGSLRSDDMATGNSNQDVVDDDSLGSSPNQNSEEDTGEEEKHGSPTDNLMEVEQAAEIRPTKTTHSDELPREVFDMDEDNTKENFVKKKELSESLHGEGNGDIEDTKMDLELAARELRSEKEKPAGGSSPRQDSEDIGGASAEKTKQASIQHPNESARIERIEAADCEDILIHEKETPQPDQEKQDAEGDSNGQDSEKEDQALIDSLVFDPPDGE